MAQTCHPSNWMHPYCNGTPCRQQRSRQTTQSLEGMCEKGHHGKRIVKYWPNEQNRLEGGYQSCQTAAYPYRWKCCSSIIKTGYYYYIIYIIIWHSGKLPFGCQKIAIFFKKNCQKLPIFFKKLPIGNSLKSILKSLNDTFFMYGS